MDNILDIMTDKPKGLSTKEIASKGLTKELYENIIKDMVKELLSPTISFITNKLNSHGPKVKELLIKVVVELKYTQDPCAIPGVSNDLRDGPIVVKLSNGRVITFQASEIYIDIVSEMHSTLDNLITDIRMW